MRAICLGFIALCAIATGCAERRPNAKAPGTGPSDEPRCVDGDGDGYGNGCENGYDCDDGDPDRFTGCLDCAQHDPGCACDPGTPLETCFLEPSEADVEGMVMCHEGTRYCRDGVWSACEDIFSYQKPKLARNAVIDPDAGAVSCNECNPICFRITDNLDPIDGGLGNSNSDNHVDWAAGGGLTLAEDPDASTVVTQIDAGSFDPSTCMMGTAPDKDCDGIPDIYDPYPDDPPFATANPTIFLDIPAGQTGVGSIDLGFFLNSADVYFLVDQSASMTDERDQLKADLTTGDFINDPSFDCADYDFDFVPNNELKDDGLVGAIRCIIRDSHFGAGFFREIPFQNYANNEQIVFDNYQDITSDVTDVQAAIDRLDTIGNYEWPEASMLALNNLITGDGMYFGIEKRGVPPRVDCPVGTWGYPCFRDDAIPIVILFTDAMMHNGPSSNDYAYNTSYLGMNVGTDAEYVPVASSNETFASARDAQDVSTRLLTFTGDTTGMSADVPASELSCLSQDGGADAVFEFNLTQQSDVTISSEGSRFDTVMGLFAGAPSSPTVLPDSANTNETGAGGVVAPLGEVVSSAVSISGDTSSMISDYSQSAVGCDADPDAADAVYTFTVAQNNTSVAISTEGSSFDSVISLHDAAPSTQPSYNINGTNANTDLATSVDLNEVYTAVVAVEGDSSSADINADFLGSEIGCGADDAAGDAVYSFELSTPTRVQISSEGSSIDTVVALVGNTCSAGSSGGPPVSAINGGGNSAASSAATHAFAAGAYVIPMDTTYQNDGMLLAFGLVYELLENGVPVSWVIAKGKSADGTDFIASATDVGTAAPITDHAYEGGPFVVDATDAASAAPFVNAWLTANPSVAVHVTTTQFDGYVRKQLIAAPAIALFNDGSQAVGRGYLQAAGIPDSTGTTAWSDAGPDVLSASAVAGADYADATDGALFDDEGVPRYCQLLTLGWDETSATSAEGQAIVNELRSFLEEPNHLFAQGQSATSIENSAAGHLLTNAGYVDVSDGVYSESITTLRQNVYDLPFAQIDGSLAGDTGGIAHFTLPAPDDYLDGNAVLITDADSLDGNHDVWVTGHLDGDCSITSEVCDPGGVDGHAQGKVSYLGGQDYSTTLPISSNSETNGVRLFLNSLFDADCSSDAGEPVITTQLSGPASTLISTVTYTVKYDNDGPGIAYDATVEFEIPSGASFVSATGGAGVSGSLVTWNLGSVAVDETGSFDVTVDYGSTGIFEAYSVVNFHQGLTERRAVSSLVSTDYNSGAVTCTSLGLISENVPTSAENAGTAHDIGELNGRIYALSGSTASMNSDYAGSFMGGGAADNVPDAAFRFTLTETADVLITTSGSSFDTVVALYDSAVGGVTGVTSTDPDDTDNAQDLGTVNGTTIEVTGGDTNNNTAVYVGGTDMSCASATSGAPDAAYKFHVSSDTRVQVSTEGSSFDTVLSMHSGSIVQAGATFTYSSLTGNESRESAFEAPATATGNTLVFEGDTTGMRGDFRIGSGSGKCHYRWDNSGPEAVVKFNIATDGDYDFTLNSDFNHGLSILAANPFTNSGANQPSWGSSGTSLAGANQVGSMDDWRFGASGSVASSTWSETACGAHVNGGTVFYEFSLDQAQDLRLSSEGSGINSVLQVYSWDDAGHTSYTLEDCDGDNSNVVCYWFGCIDWGNDDGSLDLSLGAGDYFAVVAAEGDGETGNYDLSIQDLGASASSYVACAKDNTDSSFTQTLTAGDYYAVVKGYQWSEYGEYTLTIDGGGGGSGNSFELDCEDGTADSGTTSIVDGTPGPTTANLTGPQDYYVVLKGSDTGDQGSYKLTVTDLDTPQLGSRIDYDPDAGTSTTSTLLAENLAPGDYYVILGGQTVSDLGDYEIEIRDVDAAVGTVVACDDDSGAGSTSLIEQDLAAGTYYVVVKGDGPTDEGNYKLSVRDVTNAGFNQLACDADSGPAGTSYLQRNLDIGTYYVVVKGDGPTDEGAYQLSIQDTDNNPIGAMACDDDGGSYQTSVITRTLNPGDYYVALKGYDAGESGRYQLTIGGGNSSTIKYVPPTWATTAANLQATGAKVIPVLSCQDDPYHGDADGDCVAARAQASALANATDTLGKNLQPLVFDIDRDGSGLSANVVDGITSLANYLEMDVQVVIDFDPDANPGFNVNSIAIDQPGDGCSGIAAGIEHLNCVPGATPNFEVSFENPADMPVPLNPTDPLGGYNFKALLIADGNFLVDQVPIYIIPEDVDPSNNPPDTPVYGEGAYWQDTASPGCVDNQRPDWRDLSWSAEVPANTTITFSACAAETQAMLDACTPTPIASVTGVGTCTSDADCSVGYCDLAVGACQVATGSACTSDAQCPSNAACVADVCTFTSQPVYIGSSLGILNFQPFLRMSIGLSVTDGYQAAPVLHSWELTYLCNTVD
ncbi:MAG: hypothetical protein OXU20_15555 [Myxococcales bacterium]|nr:hypothetical protein [Myxococcales bacterium]